jgi:hypothetical protein
MQNGAEVFFTENFIFGLMHPHVHVSDAEGQRILEPIDHKSQNFVMGLNTVTRRGQEGPTPTQQLLSASAGSGGNNL